MAAPEDLDRFPWAHGPRSAAVDVAALVLAGKPACRLALRSAQAADAVLSWAGATGLAALRDEDHWVVLSPDQTRAEAVMQTDRRPEPHARELGVLLGYPTCCCAMAERVGEQAIDQWADGAARGRFEGGFRLIDPSGYREGRALISHVPCRVDCLASLVLARSLAEALAAHLDQRWATPMAPLARGAGTTTGR